MDNSDQIDDLEYAIKVIIEEDEQQLFRDTG